MYAIVKTGGKQYRVERGQTLLVERLAADEGGNVALEPILYRSEEAVFDTAGLKRVKVTAKVLSHERGEKLRVFKFKPKRGYKRRNGHRQELTRIEVTDISIGGAAAKAGSAKAAAKPEAAAKPGVAAKPEAAAKSAAAAKPEGAAKPGVTAKPEAAAKPEATAKPAATKSSKPAAKPADAASGKAAEKETTENGS
jgi:large subunit ribosomal protein L21